MRMRNFTAAIILSLLAVCWGQPATAQLTKISVGYSAISGDALPAWIAKDAGIFEKNGLDAQLVFFTGGTTAVMALVSADTPMTQMAGAAVVNSVIAGSDPVIVAGGVTSLNYFLMGRPEIKNPEQLKGGSVAISRFGSSSDFIARYALSKVGLTPGKDVTIVQIGSTTARVDATLAGRVQATVVQPPASIIAQKRGMTILADLPKLGLVYQHTAAATTRKFIREHRDIVRRYVKSQVDAVHRTTPTKKPPCGHWRDLSAVTSSAMFWRRPGITCSANPFCRENSILLSKGLKPSWPPSSKESQPNPKTLPIRASSGSSIRAAISTAYTRSADRPRRRYYETGGNYAQSRTEPK